MKGLIIFIAVCSLTAAMVPMERRAVNTEEDEERLRTQSATVTTKRPVEICAPQTPCAWSIYKRETKRIEMNITNTYCVCSHGTSCVVNEDDIAVNAYILRCMPQEEGTAES